MDNRFIRADMAGEADEPGKTRIVGMVVVVGILTRKISGIDVAAPHLSQGSVPAWRDFFRDADLRHTTVDVEFDRRRFGISWIDAAAPQLPGISFHCAVRARDPRVPERDRLRA